MTSCETGKIESERPCADYVYHGNTLVLSPNSICNDEQCLSIIGGTVAASAVLIDGVFDPNQACVSISGGDNLGGCGLHFPGAATVDLTLDKFGNVIDWDSRFHIAGSLFDFEILSSPSGDSVLYNFCIPDCPAGIPGDLARWTATAGFWKPIFPTPVPASFQLVAIGLSGLGLLGWRRKRNRHAKRGKVNSPRRVVTTHIAGLAAGIFFLVSSKRVASRLVV